MYIWSRRRHLYQPLADLYPFPIYSRSRSLRGTSSFLKLASRSWQQSSKRKTPCDRRVNVLSTNFINGWGPCDQRKLDPFMKFPPTNLTVTSAVFFCWCSTEGRLWIRTGHSHNIPTRNRSLYLCENNYKFSISRDKEFTNSRATLKAKRSELKSIGKGNKPNAAEELTERREELLFEKGVIGTQHTTQPWSTFV